MLYSGVAYPRDLDHAVFREDGTVLMVESEAIARDIAKQLNATAQLIAACESMVHYLSDDGGFMTFPRRFGMTGLVKIGEQARDALRAARGGEPTSEKP